MRAAWTASSSPVAATFVVTMVLRKPSIQAMVVSTEVATARPPSALVPRRPTMAVSTST